MKNDDSVSAMTDSSRFWPGKYYKSHESILWQRHERQHQHFVRHYQQKITQLYGQLKQAEQNQQKSMQAIAVRLSQPFEQAAHTLKQKSLAFDELMQTFEQLSRGRLIRAMGQAQVNRDNGVCQGVAPLMANIKKLLQAYAKQCLVPLAWQSVGDRLSITPMHALAVQHSSFLDFRRKCLVTATMATRECQRDIWRLHNMVLDMTRLIEQLESVNQDHLLGGASPPAKQSLPLASTSASIPRLADRPPLASKLNSASLGYISK